MAQAQVRGSKYAMSVSWVPWQTRSALCLVDVFEDGM